MASFVYTPAKEKLLKGDLDFDEAGHDLRIILAMTNTTADTDQDAASLAAIGTLDEHAGTNYARKALATQVVNRDDANNRAEFDAVDVVWTALGAGARDIAGMVLYRHVDGVAANDIPIAWIDSGGFPFPSNGGDVTIQWNSEGILQAV